MCPFCLNTTISSALISRPSFECGADPGQEPEGVEGGGGGGLEEHERILGSYVMDV